MCNAIVNIEIDLYLPPASYNNSFAPHYRDPPPTLGITNRVFYLVRIEVWTFKKYCSTTSKHGQEALTVAHQVSSLRTFLEHFWYFPVSRRPVAAVTVYSDGGCCSSFLSLPVSTTSSVWAAAVGTFLRSHIDVGIFTDVCTGFSSSGEFCCWCRFVVGAKKRSWNDETKKNENTLLTVINIMVCPLHRSLTVMKQS